MEKHIEYELLHYKVLFLLKYEFAPKPIIEEVKLCTVNNYCNYNLQSD